MSEPIRIGELAARLGTTTKTLRFYERTGLLEAPERSERGYRLYDRRAIEHARLLFGLRRLGLSIEQLKSLLLERGERSLRQRLLALLDEKLREQELALSVLQGRRDELAARHEALLATPRGRSPDCVCDALLVPCTCED